MNRKGIFSVLIAAIAIVLISATIITASTSTGSVAKKDYSEKILELKREWNNARYLLDKTLSDRLADSVTGCNFTAPIIAEITAYFNSTLNNSFQNCSIGNSVNVVNSNANSFEVSVAISCSKRVGSEFEIKKFERTVTFEKDIDTQNNFPNPGNCTVTVTDNQSDAVEVYQTF